MASGMEIMMKSMLEKVAQNLPPEVLQSIGQIGQTVAMFVGRLDRIEHQQTVIIELLQALRKEKINGHEQRRSEGGAIANDGNERVSENGG